MNKISFDYSQIADFLTRLNLWDKALCKFDTSDIEALCKVVVECCQDLDQGTWEPPYLDGHRLVIPYNAPLKYRYWQGGQSISKTIQELTNDYNIIKMYGYIK